MRLPSEVKATLNILQDDINQSEVKYMHTQIIKLNNSNENNNYEEQVNAYFAMGYIYLNEKHDYINAIALYNFALALCQNEKKNELFRQNAQRFSSKIIKSIKIAEQKFLDNISKNTIPVSDYTVDKRNITLLKKIRDEINNKLAAIQFFKTIIDMRLPAGISQTDRIKIMEKILGRHNLTIQQVYFQISEQMRNFVKLMIKQCMNMLSAWRKPPNKREYSIICFGSLARDEATPYSDLEFAILLRKDEEDIKDYFRKLTQLLNIKIINLGETSPRMQFIEEFETAKLFGRYSESPTPQGFSYDGNNKDGRKTPLGNKYFDDVKEDEKYELIMTPRQMAGLHSEKWYQKNKHLSTALITAKVICGSRKLFDIYNRETSKILTSIAKKSKNNIEEISNLHGKNLYKSINQQRSLFQLEETFENYQFRGGCFSEKGHFFDAKYHLYRLPHLIIDQLSAYFSIKRNSLWDRIDCLFNKEGIVPNESAFIHVKDVVSMILYIRLQIYMKKGYRDNYIVALDKHNPQKNKDLLVEHLGFDQEMIFHIYNVLIPMQWAIENFILQDGQKKVLIDSSFYGHGPFVKGWIYEQLLDYPSAAQAYEETRCKLFEKWGHKHHSIAEILNNLGNVYKKQGRYSDALVAYEEAKGINLLEFGKEHISVAGTLHNLGNLYRILGRLDDSITALEEAKRICIKNYSEHYSLVAEVWHSLGCVYLEQHDYIKAEEYLKKSLNININTFGNNHPKVANDFNMLGCIYSDLKKIKESTEALEKAKNINENIYGKAHNSVFQNLINIDGLCNNRSQHHRKYEILYKLLVTNIKIYGKEHINVGDTWNNIGIYFLKRQRSQDAVAAFKLAIHIKKKNFGKRYLSLGETYNNLGEAYRAQNLYKEAFEAFVRAIFIYKCNHRCLDDIIYNLGLLCLNLQKFDKARKYFEQASENENLCKLAKIQIIKSYILQGNAYLSNHTYNIQAASQCYKTVGINLSVIYIKTHKISLFNLNSSFSNCMEFVQLMLHDRSYNSIVKAMNFLHIDVSMKRIDKRSFIYSNIGHLLDYNTYRLLDIPRWLAIKNYHFVLYLLLVINLFNYQIKDAKQIFNFFEKEIIKYKSTHEMKTSQLLTQAGLFKQVAHNRLKSVLQDTIKLQALKEDEAQNTDCELEAATKLSLENSKDNSKKILRP